MSFRRTQSGRVWRWDRFASCWTVSGSMRIRRPSRCVRVRASECAIASTVLSEYIYPSPHRRARTHTPLPQTQLELEDQDSIDCILRLRGGCIASPVPAVFDVHAAGINPGQLYLDSPAALAAASLADARALIAALGGSHVDSPRCDAAPLLDAEACKILTRYADEQHDRLSAPLGDLRLEISNDVLVSLIGTLAVDTVTSAFGGSVDLFKLRRAAGDAQCRSVVFHTDFAKRTMQVALNDDSEYDGGRLVFADGEDGFLQPARPAGSATTHVNSIVHGVTALTSGVRYGLFLCDTQGDHNGLLDYLLQPTLSQFGFFREAVDFLDAATDEALGALTQRYARFLHHGGDGSAPQVVSFDLELAWRTHLLHPLVYARACGEGSLVDHDVCDAEEYTATSSPADENDHPASGRCDLGLGLDLVAAMRRQQRFMRSVLADREASERVEVISDAIAAYGDFLEIVKHSVTPLEPSLIVDLVWHTHQQFPARYGAECRRLAGSFVDHDDDL